MTKVSTLEEWAAEEQMFLWGDLAEQIRRAMNGYWSMGSESVAYRIAKAIKVTGKPTPWSEVDWDLATGGVYEALVVIADATPELPEGDEMAKAVELMTSRQGLNSPEWNRQHYARTVDALQADIQLRLDLEYSEE